MSSASVLPGQRVRYFLRDGRPPDRLSPRRTFGQPRKWRHENEVLHGYEDRPDDPRQRTREPQIGLPQTTEASAPQVTPMILRRDTRELRERVVHMERLVMQDLVKHRAGRWVIFQHIAVHSEATGRGFLGQVEEREHRVIRFVVHLQVVETVPARREPISLERRRRRRANGWEQRCGALAE